MPWPTFLHPTYRTSTVEGTGTHKGGGQGETSKDKLWSRGPGQGPLGRTEMKENEPMPAMPICRQKYSSCWRHLSFYACPFFPSLFYIHARLLRNVQSPLGAEELTGSKDLSPRFGRPGQPGWGGPSGRVCNGDHRTRACQGRHQFSSVQSLSGVRLFAIP